MEKDELKTEVYAEISTESNKNFKMRVKIIPQDMEKLKSKLLEINSNIDKYCVLSCDGSQYTIKAEDYFVGAVTFKELEQGIKHLEDDLANVLGNTETLNEVVTEESENWAEDDEKLDEVLYTSYIDIQYIIERIFESYDSEYIWDSFSKGDRKFYLYDIIRDGVLLEYADKEALSILLQDYTLKEIKEKIDAKKENTDRMI